MKLTIISSIDQTDRSGLNGPVQAPDRLGVCWQTHGSDSTDETVSQTTKQSSCREVRLPVNVSFTLRCGARLGRSALNRDRFQAVLGKSLAEELELRFVQRSHGKTQFSRVASQFGHCCLERNRVGGDAQQIPAQRK